MKSLRLFHEYFVGNERLENAETKENEVILFQERPPQQRVDSKTYTYKYLEKTQGFSYF